MEKYTIDKVKDFTDGTRVLFEHDVQFNGCSYLIVFGRHINGGFVAIPNWNISAELSADGSVLYNTEKLEESGLDPATALTIAQHIKDTLESEGE